MSRNRKLPLPARPQPSWPEAERIAFTALTRPWAAAQLKSAGSVYGSWLAWAEHVGQPSLPTPASAAQFKAWLSAHLSSGAVQRYMRSLHSVVAGITPGVDVSWMMELVRGQGRAAAHPKQGRDPNRARRTRAIRADEWPADWQAAWADACCERDATDSALSILAAATREVEGARPMAASSRRTLATAVGLYLAYLREHGLPEELSEQSVQRFIDATRPHVRAVTLWGYVAALSRAALRLWPDQDTFFLRVLCLSLKAEADTQITRREQAATISPAAILNIANELIRSARSRPRGPDAAVQFRDGLIIALLMEEPLRRADICALTVSGNIRRDAYGTVMCLPINKTGTVAVHGVSPELAAWLEEYLDGFRPLLARPDRSGDALWLARDGYPLGAETLTWLVKQRTGELPQRMSPHRFRTLLASTLVRHVEGGALAASIKLGQRSPRSLGPYSRIAMKLAAGDAYRAAQGALGANGKKSGATRRHKNGRSQRLQH